MANKSIVVYEYCEECASMVKCTIIRETTDLKDKTYTVVFECIPSGHVFSVTIPIKT